MHNFVIRNEIPRKVCSWTALYIVQRIDKDGYHLLLCNSNSYGNYNYNVIEIEEHFDDFMHTYLDHDLMYKRFDVIGPEIIRFLEKGKFSDNAKRERYNWDPFKKLKKNDINL